MLLFFHFFSPFFSYDIRVPIQHKFINNNQSMLSDLPKTKI